MMHMANILPRNNFEATGSNTSTINNSYRSDYLLDEIITDHVHVVNAILD